MDEAKKKPEEELPVAINSLVQASDSRSAIFLWAGTHGNQPIELKLPFSLVKRLFYWKLPLHQKVTQQSYIELGR